MSKQKYKKIGIFSPAANFLKFFPNRRKTGINNLKNIGFEAVFAINAIRENNYTKFSVQERLAELNELLNRDLDLIIASTGGYNSIQLLDQIDYDRIKNNKITFCGFSDITALLLAIYTKTGNTVLYGPTYSVNFCDYGGIDEYTKNSFINCYSRKSTKYYPSKYIIDEFIDWKELESSVKIKEKKFINNQWKVVKSGKCAGKLLGGNIATLLLILGSEYLPIEIFDDKILFLEDCTTDAEELCSYLESLRIKGVFNRVRAVMFGKFQTEKMNSIIYDVLSDYFSDYNKPVICNMDFGHVYPILTLPIGEIAKLSCENNEINLEVYFD